MFQQLKTVLRQHRHYITIRHRQHTLQHDPNRTHTMGLLIHATLRRSRVRNAALFRLRRAHLGRRSGGCVGHFRRDSCQRHALHCCFRRVVAQRRRFCGILLLFFDVFLGFFVLYWGLYSIFGLGALSNVRRVRRHGHGEHHPGGYSPRLHVFPHRRVRRCAHRHRFWPHRLLYYQVH